MAKTYQLKVAKREQRGSRAMRKLRRSGQVPAVIYGRGGDNIALAIARHQFAEALHSRANVFELQLDDKVETALIHDIQHDALGDEILHVDFLRVSLTERVEVSVRIELHGEAKGTSAGGVLNFVLHEVTVECLPTDIPEKIRVEIGGLDINQQVLIKDLVLPEHVRVIGDPEAVVVAVQPPVAERVEPVAEVAEATAEPEVIGRKPKEEGGEEES